MVVSTTERKLTDTNASQSILQGLLNASREAILVVDASMRITASNASAQEAFVRQNGPLDARRLSEIIRDLDLHEGFQRTLSENNPTDLRIEFTGAEKRIYDVHLAPIDLEDGRHAIGVFYDITQIERLERVRQEFLSNV